MRLSAAVRPEATPAADERKRSLLAAALFGFVAIVQLLAMLSHGVTALVSLVHLFSHLSIVLPAGWFAFLLWRERRLRVLPIAFALLWGALSVWAAIALVESIGELATQPMPFVVPSTRGFVPLVVARSITFAAATVVLVTGRPRRPQRIAGAALSALFAALFLAEHLYQNVPGLRP